MFGIIINSYLCSVLGNKFEADLSLCWALSHIVGFIMLRLIYHFDKCSCKMQIFNVTDKISLHFENYGKFNVPKIYCLVNSICLNTKENNIEIF